MQQTKWRKSPSTVLTYRPLEVKGNPDGLALGHGDRVGSEYVSEPGAVGARGLRVDHVLRVLQTHAEKYPTVPGLLAAEAAGSG